MSARNHTSRTFLQLDGFRTNRTSDRRNVHDRRKKK